MTLKENVRFATEGGTGYNVFSDLPGTSKDGTFVLFGAHHDGYFHTATDDTDGIVAELLIAKAMIKSGYQPKHTVRLMATTGEDFGYVNSYFDWCIGSWWAISHSHPEWAGRFRAAQHRPHRQGQPPEGQHPRLHATGARPRGGVARPAAPRLHD